MIQTFSTYVRDCLLLRFGGKTDVRVGRGQWWLSFGKSILKFF